VRGRAIGCGHHIAEEAPDELAAELRDFFSQP
jgi:pimeloyl-ACP methyl ester carboxylesterase